MDSTGKITVMDGKHKEREKRGMGRVSFPLDKYAVRNYNVAYF